MPVDVESMSRAGSAGTGLSGGFVSDDRTCVRCGYSLRGLETTGACPECGTAITSAKKSVRHSDNLVDAPLGYIRLIAFGLGLQAASVLAIGIQFFLPSDWTIGPFNLRGVLFTLATLVWFGASWIVTVKRPRTERIVFDEILDNRHIRNVSRWAQGSAALAAMVAWAAYATGSGILQGLAGLLMLGALYALVPMGVYLSSMADWAGETEEGSRLRAATWCIAVLGTLELVIWGVLKLSPPFAMFFAFAGVIFGILVFGGVLVFAWSVLMLAKAAMWAIHNAVQAREREIRLAEKRRRRAMRDAARAHAAEAAMAVGGPPAPESYADDPSVIPFDDGHGAAEGDGRPTGMGPGGTESRVERTSDPDDSQIYGLAPED